MSTVKQLSIFLENKSGRLYEVMEILAKANVGIIAATVSDTAEFGILRLITSNNEKAHKVLEENNVPSNISEVVIFSCGSEVGGFYEKIKKMSQSNISIEYMYCFSFGEDSYVIIKVPNTLKAIDAMRRNGIVACTMEELLDKMVKFD